MTLKELVKKEPDSLIGKAYAFATQAHAGQKRLSGEAFINHPVAVAEILREWQLDEATIAAGLLHDIVEDTPVKLNLIRKVFGEDVAFLVDGVTKLERIKLARHDEPDSLAAENLRKMIIALSEDLRVIFVKLADRLHNMRTLGALPPERQKQISIETDEVYSPLAYRLGMQRVSGELRDLAFPKLHPREYDWLTKTVGEEYERRMKYASGLKSIILETLKAQNIEPIFIDFRAKHWSSLYKKLLTHDMDISKIYDLVAVRIIVQNQEECYGALGAIHGVWKPVPGRIKDYIAMPKPNGYKSLHTTVIGPQEKIVEIQIRTLEMHNEDENGIAAHWAYKEKRSKLAKKLKDEVRWVEELREWQNKHVQKGTNSKEFLESLKAEFFKGRIFVITPKGEVIDLPQKSTPVDFAYHIHTQIGHNCVGAKINGEIVPLDRELKSGDMVQILTQKNKKPSEDWLRFVTTSIAKEHIKASLRQKSQKLKLKKPN